jgi:protein-S-isoprenylcysteine O-methyltransferase Ste14
MPSSFAKIFGSGPVGVVSSATLFLLALLIKRQYGPLTIMNNQTLLDTLFYISCVATLLVAIWSLRSLPTADRGNTLCVSGAFKHVRHPLYGAFLSIFDFGLALYLNSWVFIAWAILLHPIWHWIVKPEEKMMVEVFGDEYVEYMKRTGRFLPGCFRKNRAS